MTIRSIYQVEKDVIDDLSNKIKEDIMTLIRDAYLNGKTEIEYIFPLKSQCFSHSSMKYDENERNLLNNNSQIALNIIGHLDINDYEVRDNGFIINIRWNSKEERDRKEKEVMRDFYNFFLFGAVISIFLGCLIFAS